MSPADLHTRLLAALDARLERARAQARIWAAPCDECGYAPDAETRRVEALRRVVERHAPDVDWPNSTYPEDQRKAICPYCRDPLDDDVVVFYPCPDISDLAAGEGIEVGE